MSETRGEILGRGGREALEPHVCLFNNEAYHRANMGPGQAYLRIDHVADGSLIGTLAGVMDGDTLDCGWRAPFGGVDLTAKAEPAGKVVDLVRAVIDEAREAGARLLRVRCRPAYYSPQESVVQFALLSQGFAVESMELSSGVELGKMTDAEVYRAGLAATPRQNLRRALAAGLEWVVAADEGEWAEGYAVLAQNRARLGVQLKYTLDYLLAMADRFAGRVRMNLLRSPGGIVASALIYRVLPGVDYVAAWGDAPHDLPKSPMYLVAYRVVEDAIADGVELVDFGISSAQGRLNEGLFQFKRHIGAAPALRLDLIRDLTF